MTNRFRLELALALLLVIVTVLLPACLVETAKSYPCAFADTVNITEGLRLKDGSYSYQGLVIPANMTAEYNFKVIDGVQYNAPRHTRGCACRQRPCITFCCPLDMRYDGEHHMCVPHSPVNTQHTQQAHVEVTFRNSTEKVVNIQEAFILKFDLGCWKKYIDKRSDDFWKWDLYENGTVWSGGRAWSTDEYCFSPMEHKKVWSLVPLTCEHSQRGFRLWFYVICMVLAILTNLFILCVLVSIKNVRGHHYGETLIFYLASLIVGLSALVYLALKNRLNLSETACRNIGLVAYVFVILSFLLLDFISWNFCYNFNSRRFSGWKRKLVYFFIIALAIGLKFFVSFMQDANISQRIKSGIGETFCWFDTRLWGIFLYYYIPILMYLAFAAVFCIKGFVVIWNLPSDTLTVAGYDLDLLKSHFHSFCAYLLGVTCVWIREIIVAMTVRLRGHFLIIDFWSGVFQLGLAIVGLLFLLHRNRLVQSWWRINVADKPNVDDIYMARIYPSEQARTEKLKEGYKDEIREEDIALRTN